MGRDHRWIEEPNPFSPTALLPNGPDPTHLHHYLGLASRAYLVPIEIVHGPGSLELLGNGKKLVRWGGQSRKEKGVGRALGRGTTRHCHFQHIYAKGKVEAAQEPSGGRQCYIFSHSMDTTPHVSPDP